MYILEAQKKFSQILEVAIYLIEDPHILNSDLQMKKCFRCRRRSFSDADEEVLKTQNSSERRNSSDAEFFRRSNFSDKEFKMKNKQLVIWYGFHRRKVLIVSISIKYFDKCTV